MFLLLLFLPLLPIILPEGSIMSGSGVSRNSDTKLTLKSSQREKSKAASIPVKHWQKPIKVGIATAMDGPARGTQSRTDTFSFSFALSELGLQWRNQKDTKQTYQNPLSNASVTRKLVFDLRVTISRHSRKEAQHISVPSWKQT